jgi:hypothetical protein
MTSDYVDIALAFNENRLNRGAKLVRCCVYAGAEQLKL